MQSTDVRQHEDADPTKKERPNMANAVVASTFAAGRHLSTSESSQAVSQFCRWLRTLNVQAEVVVSTAGSEWIE